MGNDKAKEKKQMCWDDGDDSDVNNGDVGDDRNGGESKRKQMMQMKGGKVREEERK